jgi:hypothetical protein
MKSMKRILALILVCLMAGNAVEMHPMMDITTIEPNGTQLFEKDSTEKFNAQFWDNIRDTESKNGYTPISGSAEIDFSNQKFARTEKKGYYTLDWDVPVRLKAGSMVFNHSFNDTIQLGNDIPFTSRVRFYRLSKPTIADGENFSIDYGSFPKILPMIRWITATGTSGAKERWARKPMWRNVLGWTALGALSVYCCLNLKKWFGK